MTRDDLHDLMLLYAAGAADEGERAEAERWLESGHPAAAAALAEARAVLAAAASAVGPVAPDAGQFERLAAAVDAADGPARPAVRPAPRPADASRGDGSPLPMLLGTAAAAAGIGALLLGGLWFNAAGGRDAAERQVARLEGEVRRLDPQLAERERTLAETRATVADLEAELVSERQAREAIERDRDATLQNLVSAERALDVARLELDLLADPAARVLALRGTGHAPAVAGRATLAADEDRVQVAVNNLDAVAADQVYQLWVLTSGNPPTSLGTFAADGGSARLSVDLPPTDAAIDAVAISLEPAGGSPAPTGKIIAVAPANLGR